MQGSLADRNAIIGESRYPKKAKLVNDIGERPERRESYFPQPSFRSSNFERDNSSGVVSPSDFRRPKEDSQLEHFERSSIESSESTTNMEKPFSSFTTTPRLSRDLDNNNGHSQNPPKEHETQVSSQNATMRESSFINEFLSDSRSKDNVDQDSWRQTVLQRRLSPEAKPGLCAKPPMVSEEREPTGVPPIASTTPIPSSQASEMILGDQFFETRIKDSEKLKQYPLAVNLKELTHEERTITTRSTSKVLSQLPEEDIDFLSADDIRANMGIKRSKSPTSDQRMAEKRELDHKFTKAIQQGQDLDPMIESQILNDQLIRRKERELREAEQSEKTAKSQTKNSSEAIADHIAESAIDRMKRWLETTGVSFAKQFWQDPTEETDVIESRLVFEKVYHYISKGRAAMTPIIEDLEKDLPVSIPLLDLLKKDEETLESSINCLRCPSQSGGVQDSPPKKIRAMKAIKSRHDQTNSELEKACAALRSLVSTRAISGVPESFKRRLSMASKVLHKNMQLSRMLLYNLQTRLEDPNLDRTILPSYRVVVGDLSSLADTQMTLVRLIDHAKLLYGVVPPSSKDSQLDETPKELVIDLSDCEEPFVRARLAADAHLLKEISVHTPGPDAIDDKSKVSDNTETSAKKSLDEPKPLTHSLFRPFAPGVERLGIHHDSDVVPENEKQVEKACDEADAAIGVTKERRFEMLKEDPATSGLEFFSRKGFVEGVNQNVEDRAPAFPNATREDPAGTAASTAVSKTTIASEPQEESKSCRRDTADAVTSGAAATEKSLPTSSTASPPDLNIPTHYTILIYDPLAENLTLTTSTTPPPRETSPAIPLHQALAELNAPAKFLPYITEGLEVITAKKDMLVLRDSLDDTTSTQPFSTINTAKSRLEDSAFTKRTINPIDGTVPLSPTGYVGPEESPEQLEKEFEERRQAAGRLARLSAMKYEVSEQDPLVKEIGSAQRKEARKRRGAGIVKTAIWAMAVCYVVGVIGEISAGSSGL